jgi:hypothetical protein
MSLKEDLKSVKQELNTEEQFLEGFVKFERFFKKNKLILIGAVSAIILGFIIMTVTDYTQEENKRAANEAFNAFLDNPQDKNAMTTLKDKNQKLYEIALYLQAQKQKKTVDVNVDFLKELVLYQEALKAQNINQLNDVSMQNDFLLKEFAIFNKALILAQQNKYKDAQETLKLIPQTSKVYELVKLLNHYLLTKV